MKANFYSIFGLVLIYSILCNPAMSQDSTRIITLKETSVTVNKFEENKKSIPQQVYSISAKEIENTQSQSMADLLINTGKLSVQKSQQGGGSPVLRGFEANRVLLMIDGVRMNNLIYRAGHLQNVITSDNQSLEKMEIVFGPSSTVYGSDAMGGVIHLYTKGPKLSDDKSTLFKINYQGRIASVNNEISNHVDFNIGFKKFASFTSISRAEYGDLLSGQSKNPLYTEFYGERNFYTQRINGKDSLIKNQNRFLQIGSGYSQIDLVQKFLFRQNSKISHGINLQLSTSSNVPRYDRLTDPKGNGLKHAEWYYGPQERKLIAYDLNFKDQNAYFQNVHVGLNFQQIEESRHNRSFGSTKLASRIENVNVFGANVDLQKVKNKHTFRTGVDLQSNGLVSTAFATNIETQARSALDTRYPDGKNTMFNTALYVSHKYTINSGLILSDGLRVGYSQLRSTFVDTSFYNFPFKSVQQNNPVYSGSIGLMKYLSDNNTLSFNISSGFRVPNVDDLGKVFESAQGKVIVPNANLKPEKTLNFELGYTHSISNKLEFENYFYYTQLYDALVVDKYQYNGQDSIIYEGVKSEVYANQNKQQSFIYGSATSLNYTLNRNFEINYSLNYTYGRIVGDSANTPLDHIAPLNSRLQFRYNYKKLRNDFFIQYSAAKKLSDYYLNGEDNEQYATKDGMPAWFTLNYRLSYAFVSSFKATIGVDNILDTQYRTFASGINAPGRNVFLSLKLQF